MGVAQSQIKSTALRQRKACFERSKNGVLKTLEMPGAGKSRKGEIV
jgi:hypothetical protein